MGLHIPKRSFRAMVVGRAFRDATCEKCGAQYVYVLSCEAEATAETSLTDPAEKSEEIATKQASAQLQTLLESEVAPIPCPRCGWLQPAMVECLRRELGGSSTALAAFALFFGLIFACIFGVICIAMRLGGERRNDPIPEFILIGSSLTVGAGVVVLIVNSWRRRRWNPNDCDRHAQTLLGRQLAILKEDFTEQSEAKLLTAADEQQLSRISRAQRNTRRFKSAVALALAGFMLYLLSSDAPLILSAGRTFGWSKTTAQVQGTDVGSEQHGEEWHYWPEVQYSYTVDGREYQGRQYGLVRVDCLLKSNARAICSELQRRRDVPVYYNPQAPDESVLVRGLPFWKSFGLLLPATMAAAGLIAAWRVGWTSSPLPNVYAPEALETAPKSPERPWLIPIVVLCPIVAIAANAALVMLPGINRADDQRHMQDQQQKLIDAEMDNYWRRAAILTEVEALQQEFDLSDEEFEDILRAEWTAGHPRSDPWRIRLGNDPYSWRINRDWNVDSVRKRCQDAAAEADGEETVEPVPP